jgi:tetratricopeptide (TPR) repeat protein
MRQTTCSRCKGSFPLVSTLTSNGQTYCETCAPTIAHEAKSTGIQATFTSNIDGSLCALCGTENPTGSDFPFRKKLPFCEKCGPLVERWPYPTWLKLSLAGLVLLLAASLIRGRTYFHAGSEMYRGEKLVKQRKYAEAVPHLKEAVRIAPASDKAVLLLATAALKIGDMQTAAKALQGHEEGHFENGQDADFLDLKALWERAIGASKMANEAGKLALEGGKDVEAAKLFREAAAEYPESKEMTEAVPFFDEGAAFERKDYDRFLSLAQEVFAKKADATNAATIASAWACKYAVSGNAQFKDEAEQFLLKAQQMAQSDAEEMKRLEEYLPRIRHRIDTREIITKQEYDKKFQSNEKEKK